MPLGMKYTFFVYTLIRMGTKIITLCLYQVGGEPLTAKSFKK